MELQGIQSWKRDQHPINIPTTSSSSSPLVIEVIVGGQKKGKQKVGFGSQPAQKANPTSPWSFLILSLSEFSSTKGSASGVVMLLLLVELSDELMGCEMRG